MTKTTSRAFNFSAGPAILPEVVLEQIQNEMLSLPGVGSSVLEISHRSKDFDEILNDATSRIAELTNLPDTHEVSVLTGWQRTSECHDADEFFNGKNSDCGCHRDRGLG